MVLVACIVAAGPHDRARAADACVGDCPPSNDRVAINELVIGVAIALGDQPLAACPSYNTNGDGVVGVGALIIAVNNAQHGCPGGPTPMATATATVESPTVTPTVTATPALGPVVGFFAVASADDTLQAPTATSPTGIPIYQRLYGSGFVLIVEAQPGGSLRDVGASTFAPGGLPDLQIQATRDLGNGSPAVCDNQAPFGGVPGIDPPDLGDPSAIADALNDFGCRFNDGTGAPSGRPCSFSCVRFATADSHCVDDSSQEQFCVQVDMPLQFPDGDTLVTVRVRDVVGHLGPPAQLIVRIAQ